MRMYLTNSDHTLSARIAQTTVDSAKVSVKTNGDDS